MGEGARLCLEALIALGYEATGFDLSPLFGRGDMPGAAPHTEPIAPGAGTVILDRRQDKNARLAHGRYSLHGRTWDMLPSGPSK